MPIPHLPRKGKDEPPRGPGDRMPSQKSRPRFLPPLWWLLAGIALVLVIKWAASGTQYKEMGYGKFRKLLAEGGKIYSVTLTGDKVRGELTEKGADGKRLGFAATRPAGDDKLYELLEQKLGPNWEVRTFVAGEPHTLLDTAAGVHLPHLAAADWPLGRPRQRDGLQPQPRHRRRAEGLGHHVQ